MSQPSLLWRYPNPVRAAPATSPPPQPLGAMKEGAELEAEEELQESQQDGVNNIMIPMTENLAKEISNNKHCVNNCPGIEISECDNTNCTNPENTSYNILEENSISIPHSNPQINYSGIEEGKEKAPETTQSDDKGQSSHNVLPFPWQQMVLSRVVLNVSLSRPRFMISY